MSVKNKNVQHSPNFSNRMKTLLFLPVLLVSFVLQSFQTLQPENTLPPRWEILGVRKVNFGVDRDEILVTASEGSFTAMKFKVKGAPINMRKMAVHYGNGEVDEIDLRFDIPAGGESRIIDLNGRERIVKKVVFWYDTKNRANHRATLELWGRH